MDYCDRLKSRYTSPETGVTYFFHWRYLEMKSKSLPKFNRFE